MEEERYNYIVLDFTGSQFNTATGKATWTIPQHFFSEYKHNDDLYIELECCVFNGALGGGVGSIGKTSTIYVEGINIYNQKNTYTEYVLAVVSCDIAAVGSNYFLTSNGINSNKMKLRTDRFSKISLSVNHEELFVNINDEPYQFILKVSYKSKKD